MADFAILISRLLLTDRQTGPIVRRSTAASVKNRLVGDVLADGLRRKLQ